MRRFVFSLVLLVCSAWCFAPRRCLADKPLVFSNSDTEMHMILSLQLSLSGTAMLRSHNVPRWKSILISSLLTFGIATAKELVIDKGYSPNDQWANVMGIGTSAVIAITVGL